MVDLPKNYVRNYDMIAYKVKLCSTSVDKIKLRWKKQGEQFDELLFPNTLEKVKDTLDVGFGMVASVFDARDLGFIFFTCNPQLLYLFECFCN